VYIWYIAYSGISMAHDHLWLLYTGQGKQSEISLENYQLCGTHSQCLCSCSASQGASVTIWTPILVLTSLSICHASMCNLAFYYTFVSCMSRSPGWNGASNAAILNPQNQRLQISDLNKRLLWTCIIDQWTTSPSWRNIRIAFHSMLYMWHCRR
jgi:hypothetical protein